MFNRDEVVKQATDNKFQNMGTFKTVKDFNKEHVKLADKGYCDTTYGVEYERVLLSWLLDGKPSDIKAYIRTEANRLV